MTNFFLSFLNLSITASYIALAAIVLRFLLKKHPKWISCLLWALVAVRLLVPFTFESRLSLVPDSEPIKSNVTHSESVSSSVSNSSPHTPIIYSGDTSHTPVTPVTPITPDNSQDVPHQDVAPINPQTNQDEASEEGKTNIYTILSYIWIAGAGCMIAYSALSFLRIRKRVRASIRTEKNICLCDDISTPFILGVIKPKIYLPSTLSGDELTYIINHEKAHLKRCDHLWKPLGFILLSLHWFNPLMWISYILLCRDIELACDEKVLKSLGTHNKKNYCETLLSFSSERKLISACPLAFGEVGIKQRIKNVLNYKKPAFWITAISLVLCVAVGFCFLTNPVKEDKENTDDSTTSPTKIYTATDMDVTPVEGYLLYSIRVYVLDGESYEQSYIKLYPDEKRFELMMHHLSSYLPTGTYTIEDDKLILKCDQDDNRYVFRIRLNDDYDESTADYNDTDTFSKAYLMFLENESSKLPKFKYSEKDTEATPPFKNGDIFYPQKTVWTHNKGEVNFDIDSDGEEERCVLSLAVKDSTRDYPLCLSVYDKNAKLKGDYVIPDITIDTTRSTATYYALKAAGGKLYLHIDESTDSTYFYPIQVLSFNGDEITLAATYFQDIIDYDIDHDGYKETLSISPLPIFPYDGTGYHFAIQSEEYGVYKYYNEFELFTYHNLRFEEDGGKLYLVTTTADTLMIERRYEVITEKGLIVLSCDGDTIPYYEDGFTLSNQTSSFIIDQMRFDIDGDGKKEDVTITPGYTSGVFSMIITAKRDGETVCETHFSGPALDFSFEKEKDGTVYLQGIQNDYISGVTIKETKIHKYDIKVVNPRLITLTEDGVSYSLSQKSEHPSYFEKVVTTLLNYAEGYKNHDVIKLNACFDHTFIDPRDKAAIDELVNTVTDCKIESVKFIEESDDTVKFHVTYEITYNEDYLGVGNRLPGFNRVSADFIFTEDDGEYFISSMDLEGASHIR